MLVLALLSLGTETGQQNEYEEKLKQIPNQEITADKDDVRHNWFILIHLKKTKSIFLAIVADFTLKHLFKVPSLSGLWQKEK